MSSPEHFWAGEFGIAYTLRNKVDWMQRRSFWELVLERTAACRVLEVGCGAGWNLLALRQVDPRVRALGVDVNRVALDMAQDAGADAVELPAARVGTRWPQAFDLVFTAGVLIHVPPAELATTMVSIIAASRRWVLAVEYAAAAEEEVLYRGHAERLWRRPFGVLYEALGLTLQESGHLERGDGFDDCTWWLLKKPDA
jgi:pseudaminic acid biosynthesis-associated methylase